MLASHLHLPLDKPSNSAVRPGRSAPWHAVAPCSTLRPLTADCIRSRPVLRPQQQQQRRLLHRDLVITHVAQRSLAAILSEVEELKASADALETELAEVSRAAEGAAKRSRRLAARSHELQEYALEHVMLGDEPAARAALQQKAAVADALSQATRRAEANSALARKLEEVLVLKQSRMLALIREGNRQQAAAAAAASASGEAATESTTPSRGLKRSRSVAWSSATLHASSDGFTEAAEVAAAAAEAAAAARKLQTSSASSSSADNR